MGETPVASLNTGYSIRVPNRGDAQRANPVDDNLYAVDVDLDRSEREEFVGAPASPIAR